MKCTQYKKRKKKKRRKLQYCLQSTVQCKMLLRYNKEDIHLRHHRHTALNGRNLNNKEVNDVFESF